MFLRQQCTLATRLTTLGTVLVLAGCLHNAGNYEMAQAAQSNFAEAKIGSSLDAEKELSAKMRVAELAAVQKDVEAQRDLALATILNGKVEVFSKDIDDLLTYVVGDVSLAWRIRSAEADLINRTKLLQDELRRYEMLSAKVPSAPKLSCPLKEPLAQISHQGREFWPYLPG